ncbi:MAG: potassium transporter Kup [Methanobacteriota archaeon]
MPGISKALLALFAIGVVFGDIGTSPLYAVREAFDGDAGIPPTLPNVLGVLSLVFWSLVAVVSVKYLAFVLRADNRGEGGILALLALSHPDPVAGPREPRGTRRTLLLLGIFGAALLYGDGMLTPAISVLAAVEGLHVATPVLEPFVVPITVAILLGLFLLQQRGTARLGALFGPVTLVWFVVIGVLGARAIVRTPEVLGALSPLPAVAFFLDHGLAGFFVLGAVFLVVTGAEALYADVGHFGRGPIRAAWFAVAFPALVLNYFGQGALILEDPSAVTNPFYFMAPRWALYPLVALATAATVIASQAIITGSFSLTMQAVHLGYAPRLEIQHTSRTERGQVYLPIVNWALAAGTIWLVITFRTSSALAGAYGVALTTMMLITTTLFYHVVRDVWGWSRFRAGFLVGGFLVVDLAFFAANLPKVPAGGWFPLAVALAVFTVMTTWRRGRAVLGERLRRAQVPLDEFLRGIASRPPVRAPGTVVYLTGNPNATPPALQQTLAHLRVLHERVILFTAVTLDVAHAREAERLAIEDLGAGFHRVVARSGFMETPNVPLLLYAARAHGLDVDPGEVTYVLGRERIVGVRGLGGIPLWRAKLFEFTARNAHQATAFFRLPPERVIEVGAQIKL